MLDRLIDNVLLMLLQRSHSLARRTLLSVPRRVGGELLQVPVVQGAGLGNLRPDPYYSEIFRQILRRMLALSPGAVVDVGCNVGQFAQACVLAERQRRYLGFDVSLACCHYLQRFIDDNALPAHQVFALGLADQAGALDCHSDGPFDVCASLDVGAYRAGRFAARSQVLTERGDRVLARLGVDAVAVLKVDVEGAEPQVLAGFAETIERQRPFVIFEVFSYAHLEAESGDRAERDRVIEHRRASALAIDAFFSGRDYQIYRLRDDGRLERRVTVDPQAFSADTASDHLALPREHAAAFLAGYPYPVRERVAAAAA